MSVQESDSGKGITTDAAEDRNERLKECRCTKKGSGFGLGVFSISCSTCMNSLFFQHMVMRNEEIIWLPL